MRACTAEKSNALPLTTCALVSNPPPHPAMPTEPSHEPIDFQPPDEIYAAARLLVDYFTMQGMNSWRFMGVAARTLVDRLEAQATRAPSPSPGAPAEWMRFLAGDLFDKGYIDGDRRNERRWQGILAIIAKHAPACDTDKPAWRTMEDAPRDGTDILLYSPKFGVCHANWNKFAQGNRGGWLITYDNGDGHGAIEPNDATHWMPLPAPPAAAKEGE